MELQNKVAWITGGARMGMAIAQVLAQEGCRIVLTYRKSRKPVDETVRQLQALGFEAVALRCDLSRAKDIKRVVRQIDGRFGRLDILVHMASVFDNRALSSPGGAKAWAEQMKIHAEGTLLASLAVIPLIRRSGGGRLIHISDWTSASGRPRYQDYGPYYVSKLAVKGLVEALALELAPDILVNAIAPGPILPPPGTTPKELAVVRKATPLARWGGPEEIAKAVLFLTQTDFITGETIRVDGGRHLV